MSDERKDESTDLPKSPKWIWPFWTAVFVVLAFLIPNSWISDVKDVYGSDSATAFSSEVAALDDALLKGRPVQKTWDEVQRLKPQIMARRLARISKLSETQVGELTLLLRESQNRINAEATESGKRGQEKFRNEQIQSKFTRIHKAAIGPTLSKVERDIVANTPNGNVNAACENCHTSFMPNFDIVNPSPEDLWPRIPSKALSGRGLPILMDSLDLDAFKSGLGGEQSEFTCQTCHTSHGDKSFAVDIEKRRDAMGLWIEVYRIEDAVYVLAKVKNAGASHRAPGGYIGRAYAVVVEAFEGDNRDGTPLPHFYGERLPEVLRTDSMQAGTMFWRRMLDAEGNLTSDHRKATKITDDSRLLGDRFVDHRYVFKLPEPEGKTAYNVIVRLVYLPDYTTWEGSEDVEVRIFKTG